jgi:aminoglycoside phosphotransferase (APT) family kinase protein
MTNTGTLIAQGRAADVYDHGSGLVLRRYRTPHDCLYEAAVMQYVAEHGYPVPAVVEVAGGDIVMERVDGPTMLQEFGRRPWRLWRYANMLAALMERLHTIPAPPWLAPRLGDGDAFVHLDLHPDNVMLTGNGPVVIDWTNAGRGAPEAEIADLWLIMSNATVPGSRVEATLIGWGRGLFLRTFMQHFERDAVRRFLPIALEHRLRDRNILEAERARMQRFVGRWALSS